MKFRVVFGGDPTNYEVFDDIEAAMNFAGYYPGTRIEAHDDKGASLEEFAIVIDKKTAAALMELNRRYYFGMFQRAEVALHDLDEYTFRDALEAVANEIEAGPLPIPCNDTEEDDED